MDVKVSLLNRGARSRGTGDVLLIRQLLYNKGIRKEPIGHADLVCTYTGPRARQCSGTYSLPRGTIVVSGSVRFRAFFKLAVVGGTELYDNVRGSLTVTKYHEKGRGARFSSSAWSSSGAGEGGLTRLDVYDPRDAPLDRGPAVRDRGWLLLRASE